MYHVDPYSITGFATDCSNLETVEHEDKEQGQLNNPGVLTRRALVKKCKEHGGYRSPELNHVIYLNHCNLNKLCSFEGYSQLSALYLNGNELTDLSVLAPLNQLKFLNLSQNGLCSLDTLPRLASLASLDISYNFIENLSGWREQFPVLTTLLASRNKIREVRPQFTTSATADDRKGEEKISSLSVLDLSHNKIDALEHIVEFLEENKELNSLMLHGNAFVPSSRGYRKGMIAKLNELKYLDEYPVFTEERSCAEAFENEGHEAEQAKKTTLLEEKEKERKEQLAFFKEVQEKAKQRRESLGKVTAPSPYLLAQDTWEDIYIPCNGV